MKYKLAPWKSPEVAYEIYTRCYLYKPPEGTPTYKEHMNILFTNSGLKTIQGRKLEGEVLILTEQNFSKLYYEATRSLQKDRKIYIMSYSNDDPKNTPTFEEFMSILTKVSFPGNKEGLNPKETDIRNIFLAEKCHGVLNVQEYVRRARENKKFIKLHPELIEGIIQPEIQQEAASAASVEPVVQALECPVEPEIDSARPLDGAHDKPIGEAGVSFDGGS